MGWAKIDDRFFVNRKSRAVGLEGRSLFLASVVYCAMQENDGRLPVGDLEVVAGLAGVPVEVGTRLIDVGMWHDHGDVIEVHDYLTYNPSREQIVARREADAKRQAKSRQESRRDTEPEPVVSPSVPSRPVPTDPSSSSSSSSDLVPAEVWQAMAKKKQASSKSEVGDFRSWSKKVIANAKADDGEDAAWMWTTYEISVDQLATILAGGERRILANLPKRKDPAA